MRINEHEVGVGKKCCNLLCAFFIRINFLKAKCVQKNGAPYL